MAKEIWEIWLENEERWDFSTLKKFINHYNDKRPHMSLDYLTPMRFT